MIVSPQPPCHNRLKSLNSFSVSLLANCLIFGVQLSGWAKFSSNTRLLFSKFAPKEEMDDHKMYYDKRDLWPVLVKAGFLPSNLKLRYHKFRLNLFASARKEIP